MSKALDLTNQRFGRLIALNKTQYKNKSGSVVWSCKCDCGRKYETTSTTLKSGNARSCGCIIVENCKKLGSKKAKDLSGQKFGKLFVLSRLNKIKDGIVQWKCICDCGEERVVNAGSLISGHTKSCGCIVSDLGKKTIKNANEGLGYIENTCISHIKSKVINKNNTTGVTGVFISKGKYRAVIDFKKKRHYLGTYEKLEDATRARQEAEKKLHGEFVEWYYNSYPDKKAKCQ